MEDAGATMSLLVHEVVGAAVLLALVAVVLATAALLRALGIAPELTRKAAHVLTACAVLPLPYLVHSPFTLPAIAVAAAAGVWALRRAGRLGFLDDVGRSHASEYCYVAALLILGWVTHGDPVGWRSSVLVLGFSDAAAALVGARFGRHRYTVLGATRSGEGSLACALTTFAVVSVVSGDPIRAAVAAVIVTLVEALSPGGFDNLTVPLAALFALRVETFTVLNALVLITPVVLAGLVHQWVRRRGLFAALNRPIDVVAFGQNKTLRGFAVMPLLTGAFFALERAALPSMLPPGPLRTAIEALPVWSGVPIGFAYVLAELPNSYLKRRMGIAAGQASTPLFRVLDHVDSALGCAVAFMLLLQPLTVVAVGLLLAPLVHVVVNQMSFALKLRSSPW